MQVPYPLFRTQRYKCRYPTHSLEHRDIEVPSFRLGAGQREDVGLLFRLLPAVLLSASFSPSSRADYDVRVAWAGNEPGEPDSSSTLSLCVLSDYNLPAYCGHVREGHVTLLAVSGIIMSHCWPCQGGSCHTIGCVRDGHVTL